MLHTHMYVCTYVRMYVCICMYVGINVYIVWLCIGIVQLFYKCEHVITIFNDILNVMHGKWFEKIFIFYSCFCFCFSSFTFFTIIFFSLYTLWQYDMKTLSFYREIYTHSKIERDRDRDSEIWIYLYMYIHAVIIFNSHM